VLPPQWASPQGRPALSAGGKQVPTEFHKPAPLEGKYASQKDSTVTVSHTGMQYSTAPVAHEVNEV